MFCLCCFFKMNAICFDILSNACFKCSNIFMGHEKYFIALMFKNNNIKMLLKTFHKCLLFFSSFPSKNLKIMWMTCYWLKKKIHIFFFQLL